MEYQQHDGNCVCAGGCRLRFRGGVNALPLNRVFIFGGRREPLHTERRGRVVIRGSGLHAGLVGGALGGPPALYPSGEALQRLGFRV